MSRISIVIMAHPKRKDNIPYLKDKLNNPPIVWDRINNVWDTAYRAWDAIDRSAEYGLICQDDIIDE